MSDLTAKFAALEAQLAEQEAAADTDRNLTNTRLQSILNELDTIIVNNAANTRALLLAIGQNSPCAPCPTPSVIVPPVATIPTTADNDKCQRAQAMVQMIKSVLAALDDLMNLNVSASWTLITDVYSQIIATLDAGDTIPLPSFPEAVNIAGNFFSFAAARLFSGETLVGVFSELEFDLRDAIYNGGDAAGAQSAYNAIISGSTASDAAKFMLQAVPYSALWSYFIDPESEPNLTGFDGTACTLAPGGCFEFTSVNVHYTELNGDEQTTTGNFGPFVAHDEVTSFSGNNHLSVPCFYDGGDLTGWTMEVLSGSVGVQWRESDLTSFGSFTFDGPYTSASGVVPLPADAVVFHFYNPAPFSIRICSPEEV